MSINDFCSVFVIFPILPFPIVVLLIFVTDFTSAEVFMTGTAAEVKSVTKINKTTIGNGKIGNITKTLQKSFMDIVMGKDQKFASWLRYI
jgi:hypothetical protein